VNARAKHPLPIRAAELLASLAQHRVLSTPQLAALHFPGRSPRTAQTALAALAEARLAAFVTNFGSRGAPRRCWYVTGRGAGRAVEAGLLEEMPRLLDAEAAAGPLQAHTLAVNDVGVAFVEAARERGEDFGPLGWRHEVAHQLGLGRRAGRLIADAVLSYLRLTETDAVFEQRFLELDRASLPVGRLATELGRYGQLLRARGKHGEPLWRSRYPSFPSVLCVLEGADRAALRRRRDTTIGILHRDTDFTGSRGLSIRFCLAEDLAERGPFGPIFPDARDPGKPVDWLRGEGGGSR
jgi:hypothetical protein